MIYGYLDSIFISREETSLLMLCDPSILFLSPVGYRIPFPPSTSSQPTAKFRYKVTRYGLCQIEYMKYTYNRQLMRGTAEYYRCDHYTTGCKARLTLNSGVLKIKPGIWHNHEVK